MFDILFVTIHCFWDNPEQIIGAGILSLCPKIYVFLQITKFGGQFSTKVPKFFALILRVPNFYLEKLVTLAFFRDQLQSTTVLQDFGILYIAHCRNKAIGAHPPI